MAEILDNTTIESIFEKPPAYTKGMFIAYASLVIMAIIPIFLGSFRSLKLRVQNKIENEVPAITIVLKRAMIFPVIASDFLYSLYIIFKVFPREHINVIMTAYYYILGVLDLNNILRTILLSIPESTENMKYNWKNMKFVLYDVLCFISCAIVGSLYLYNKHWIVNNIFGLVYSVTIIELFHLNNFRNGCIFLFFLFIYDIFWVFGTNIMITVATSFDAPIKLMFPEDLLENGVLAANDFAMLGLGDILVPGIFIAFLLKFDQSLKRNTNLYFNATLLAYFSGLVTTVFFSCIFEAAQPALLYIVPACLITPMLVALVTGDLSALFSYEDHKMELEQSSKED